MVMCNMDIPRPPPPPFSMDPKYSSESVRSTKSITSQGFRLSENNQDETGSVYSIYKQKIDSMFESDSSSTTKNSVQARIEKMFTDVAKDDDVASNEIGCHVFSVDYMGSVPLDHKVASLAGLQEPLKELYFSHKRNSKVKKPLTGRLEISPVGLKVQYEGETGDTEHLNSFPTIAVWSAVKFVLHKDGKTSYAFLPLITDPDNLDKQTLFRDLDRSDCQYFTNETHSPLFAVVMRKLGVPKLLECHGFICQTSEDAIVIAATLYKSLMSHMKSKDKKPENKNGVSCISVASSLHNETTNTPPPVRPPRKKRSSSSSISSEKDMLDCSDTKPLLTHYTQMPKKNTRTRKLSITRDIKPNLDEIIPFEEIETSETEKRQKAADSTNIAEKFNSFMSAQQKQLTAEIKQVINDGSNRGLRKTPSRRKQNKGPELDKQVPDSSGDILTKVTIPRSGSFLNAGGLTKYKSKMSRANGQATGGSPLGFSELFNEFRLQEGLHSVDEILGAIIDPEGMSFNDLKPIYKEFLLKLALTLTKDELFQRSKAIMRRQKKTIIRRNSTHYTQKKTVIVTRKFRSLKHIFHKTLKAKLSKKFAKTSKPKVMGPSVKNHQKLPESSISTSSYDTRQFRPKPMSNRLVRKQSSKKRNSDLRKSNRRPDRASTSEESDFFSSTKDDTKGVFQVNTNPNRNSSSGYVSCSECSFDSDTCTCAAADKCYCSLGQRNLTKKHRSKCKKTTNCIKPKNSVDEKYYNGWHNANEALSWCGWDTDSCTDSNKCYCNRTDTARLLEQLKHRGVIHTSEHVQHAPNHRQLCKSDSNTKSSKSLEYMENPTEEYYQKVRSKQLLAIEKRRSFIGNYENKYNSRNLPDYELLTTPDASNIPNSRTRNRYERATSECGRPAVPMYQPASVRSFHSATQQQGRHQGKSVRSTSLTAEACTEALSMKKSAEIAALFADLKLSQTTDITHLISQNHISDFRRMHQAGSNSDKPYSNIEATYTSVNPKNSNSFSNKGPKNISKSKMYSAKNGLYTIQSQSDDSRRSSLCDKGPKSKTDYFDLDSHKCHLIDVKSVSSNIENSLGYLP